MRILLCLPSKSLFLTAGLCVLLDVRANRTFSWDRRRLTLFLEAINLLNRDNVRFSPPSINRRTFEATNLYDSMVPRIPSVGVLLEF